MEDNSSIHSSLNHHRYATFAIVTFLIILTIGVVFISQQFQHQLVAISQSKAAEPTLAGTNTFTHGPLVGAVSDTSATVWVRIQEAKTNQNLSVSLKSQTAGEAVKTASLIPVHFTTDSGWDYTWKAEVENLTPLTTYIVNVRNNGINLAPPIGKKTQFKTFASKGVDKDFKIHIFTDFGTKNSSQDYVVTNTFPSAASEPIKPDMVVVGGDFWHFNSAQGLKPDQLNKFIKNQQQYFKYSYMLNSPIAPLDDFVSQFLANYPLVHFFDDHDQGLNNTDKTFQWKTQSIQVLKDFFPVYQEESMTNGDWQQFSYGQADFFVLDTRSQRDPNSTADGPAKSMLGQEQLQFLKNGLISSTAKWKIIFSPSPFNPTLPKNDAWAGFKFEHDDIVNFVKTNGTQGVIVISGDAHAGGIDDGTNAGLAELFVPSPNVDHCATVGPTLGTWSHGSYGTADHGGDDPPCPGYGTVRILTNPDRAVLRVKDDNGRKKLMYRYFLNPQDSQRYKNLAEDE
ncbi:alkaline phosphatase D family protein [Candidatus Gottesmanbacteria bacterium]|nr:alkaline phosphatase D family protein [Candidatus Gottesmanbacteria bacterium]